MAKRRSKQKVKQQREPLLKPYNYQVLGVGLALIFIGFLIMYLENKVNGFVSLFISPLLILGGYGSVIHAIMSRKQATDEDGGTSEKTTGNPVAS